jgi:hypothetical protein
LYVLPAPEVSGGMLILNRLLIGLMEERLWVTMSRRS